MAKAPLTRVNLSTSSVDVEIGPVDNDCVGTWVLQVTGTIGSGTIAPKGYAQGSPAPQRTGDGSTALATTDAVGLPYYGQAGTVVTGATAISALGIYRVICPAGVSLVLSYTAGGGSDLVVHARRQFGAPQ